MTLRRWSLANRSTGWKPVTLAVGASVPRSTLTTGNDQVEVILWAHSPGGRVDDEAVAADGLI